VNELGGLDIYMGRRFLMTDSPGGDYEEMGLTANGKETLERTVAHEMGHTAGFTHDHSHEYNPSTEKFDGPFIPYHVMAQGFWGIGMRKPNNQIGFRLNQSLLLDVIDRIRNKNRIEINKTRK
jgi:hypothetical protein